VSAGLDYPAVGPEHVWLHEQGRIEYTRASDREAVEAFHRFARTEGILAALESSHALAETMKRAGRMGRDRIVLVNLSGRGDKDVESVLEWEAAATASARGASGDRERGVMGHVAIHPGAGGSASREGRAAS
jgi:tryptophan synthase beta subunit